MKEYTTKDFEGYQVTGIDTLGRRFKIVTDSYMHASMHNVFRGTLWGVLPSGKRKKLHTWWNL